MEKTVIEALSLNNIIFTIIIILFTSLTFAGLKMVKFVYALKKEKEKEMKQKEEMEQKEEMTRQQFLESIVAKHNQRDIDDAIFKKNQANAMMVIANKNTMFYAIDHMLSKFLPIKKIRQISDFVNMWTISYFKNNTLNNRYAVAYNNGKCFGFDRDCGLTFRVKINKDNKKIIKIYKGCPIEESVLYPISNEQLAKDKEKISKDYSDSVADNILNLNLESDKQLTKNILQVYDIASKAKIDKTDKIDSFVERLYDKTEQTLFTQAYGNELYY